MSIEKFLFFHSFEIKDGEIWGFLLTNSECHQVWRKQFRFVDRKSTNLKTGSIIDVELEEQQLWQTVEKKFNKIDNFRKNYFVAHLDDDTVSDIEIDEEFEISESSDMEIEIEIIENVNIDLIEEGNVMPTSHIYLCTQKVNFECKTYDKIYK